MEKQDVNPVNLISDSVAFRHSSHLLTHICFSSFLINFSATEVFPWNSSLHSFSEENAQLYFKQLLTVSESPIAATILIISGGRVWAVISLGFQDWVVEHPKFCTPANSSENVVCLVIHTETTRLLQTNLKRYIVVNDLFLNNFFFAPTIRSQILV